MVFRSIHGRGKQPRRKKGKCLCQGFQSGEASVSLCLVHAPIGNQGVCRSSGILQGKWWNPSEALCCPQIFHQDLNTPKAWTWTSGYLVISPPSPASEPEEQDGLQEKSFIRLTYKVKTKCKSKLCVCLFTGSSLKGH